ncbi:MAG TPA: nuclear transport factor 2 family protein [Acidimicrobiia bacterium]|nr:nuclear transport factor 2 family protein [Acidimicrobiia bacterium]
MRVGGFNRVELVVREDEIAAAVAQFNEALGLRLPAPHAIAGHPVLSATDFDGHIELVAPVGGAGPFGRRLAEHGAGQIGPLVWEIDDVDEARAWLDDHGYRITFEYDSRAGNGAERAAGVHQLVLDPAQWFGFRVTLMRRSAPPPPPTTTEANTALARAFCDAFTGGDWDALALVLHEEFRWRAPTARHRDSPQLVDAPVLMDLPGYTKAETLEIFRRTTQACVGGRFDLTPVSFTAEADRVAMEAVGHAVNAANGRTYDNRYCHLFTCRAGQIVELREYQDTLLLYDVWMAP